MNEEIMEIVKVKGQMLADDDTGADVVGKLRKPKSKKKILEKITETKKKEPKPVIQKKKKSLNSAKKNMPKKLRSN